MSVFRHDLRISMEEKMREGQLITLKVPAAGLHWIGANEVWINDALFDVESKVLIGNVYVLRGLYDKEETLLVHQHHHNMTGEENEQNEILSGLFSFLQNIYTSP